MKKIFAYSLTAILLGAVIILFPLQIFSASHGVEGPVTPVAPYLRTLPQLACEQEGSWADENLQKLRETYGLGTVESQPTDPFVGILAISFFVALVAYFLFRRRRPDSAFRYSQYLRRF